MPFPAFIKFHLNGTVLSGRTMKAWALDDVREVLEFDHEVGNGHYEDLGYRKEWAYSHSPMTVITEIGNHVPQLYNSICSNKDLEKVEIFWPQYKTKEHKNDIYFTHKLWPVKIRSVELFFPNVKDRQFEKYGHLAKIVFRYHWIEWKYVQGNRIFKGEWPSFTTEGMKDDKNRQELEEILKIPMSAEELAFLEFWENKNKKSTQQKQEDLTDSVGLKGKNIPKDISKVKKRLKELGYPVKDESETLAPEDIKAIKFFQAQHKEIPHGIVTVDGKIDKGGKTEKTLFGASAKKYDPPKKTDIKPLEASIEKRKNDALNGTDETAKKAWANVMKAWNEVSPYLPDGARMESGYRSTESQRQQLQTKYKSFQQDISDKFGKDVWLKYTKLQQATMTENEIKDADIEMHRQICEAVSSNEVALPGKSKHEFGKAADSQLADVTARIRALLWYSIEFNGTIRNITRENNNCGHFEFD